jgi:hypothetical protein
MTSELLGLPIDEACRLLENVGAKYCIMKYRSFKPYPDADETRVVRAVIREDGTIELLVSKFKTRVSSQG